MEEITDDSLMMLYRNGDADAFDVLFDRHHSAVYNFAWALLHDAHQAFDVLQDTFLAVARITNYEPRGHFKTWLLRVCRNRCFNIIETNRLRQKITAERGFEMVYLTASIPTPDVKVDGDDRVALVRARMATLPERQREAITLYAFEDMAYRDIAEVLEMPIDTVKTLIHRARKSLAEALRDDVSRKEK